MNTSTQLPSEVSRFLQQLESRNLTLTVQKKKSEVGDWRNEFQIRGGAVFGSDWEKLRRYRKPLEQWCEERNLVDEAFSEIEVSDCSTRKVNVSAFERMEKAKQSDKRAIASREEVRAVVRHEKASLKVSKSPSFSKRADKWNEAQENWILENYHNKAIWPIAKLKRVELVKRKENVLSTMANLGTSRTWNAVEVRIRMFQRAGRLQTRAENAKTRQ